MAPKAKATKMSLGTFLGDETLGSWADEMEDMPIPVSDSRPGYSSRPTYGGSSDRYGGGNTFGGERTRDGYSIREELPLPSEPPYTAHIGNLSFDATQADIGDFFGDCEVTNVRIVEDKLDRKPKGFGYVEFGSLEGLKKALAAGGTQFQGRNIRVSVAEPPKDRQEGRVFDDWTRRGPLPDLPNQRRGSDRPGFGRNFDNASDAGTDGGRRAYEPAGDGKVRDFGNWERKGPLSPAAAAPMSLREGGRQQSSESSRFRKSSPAWGEGRSQDGSRPPRREFVPKPAVERAPTAAESDNQWRARMKPDAPAKSPEPSTPASPAAAPALASRPRLNLQKRTVSEAEPAPLSAASTSGNNPFGGARPIDTFAREREVEEKREAAVQAKKEADEKAKADRAEEKRVAKEKAQEEAKKAEEEAEKSAETTETPAAESKAEEEVAEVPEIKEGAEAEAAADATPVEDKAVKPKEIVREAPPSKTASSWRRDGPPPNRGSRQQREPREHREPRTPREPRAPREHNHSKASADSTSGELQDDGWSTVPNRARNSRRGAGRAIAS